MSNELKILSVEECMDKDYGESLVQYSLGDGHVSFAFCNVDVTDTKYDISQIENEILNQQSKLIKGPLWSDLSDVLRNEILESEFDMHFIECDDEDWSKEKADAVFEEVKKFNLDSAITRGEDGALFTFYADAMGSINWFGHYHYGEPCLEDVILSQDKINELKAQNGIFEYVDSYGGVNFVQFRMGMYLNNNNLYLGLDFYEPSYGCMEPYGDVTVNTHANMPYLHSLIDTNNNGPKLVPFLIENGFGELTGRYVQSGFCSFPVFKFSEEKLKELCPEEFLQYQKAYGKTPPLDSMIDKCVKEARMDVKSTMKKKDNMPQRE